MADSGKENAVPFQDEKYKGGKALPFFDHDFTGYHTTEWYQWEVNIQLLARGTTQLNSANDIRGKVKFLLVKLGVENFSKAAKDVKDLLDYNVIDGHNKN
eukprot:14750358-Ditylum_brightwellii.AAC.1